MHFVAFIAEKILAAVFLLAGATKLMQGRQWTTDAAALGTPPALAPLVPWWELLVGALLAVELWRPVPAIAAAATLMAFTVVLVRVLRSGTRPTCACFGALSARPVSWGHVARNGVFVLLAVMVIAKTR
jgi:hypothetical protein